VSAHDESDPGIPGSAATSFWSEFEAAYRGDPPAAANGTGASAQPGSRAKPRGTAPEGDEGVVDALLELVETTTKSVATIADVYGDRVRVAMQKKVLKIAVGLVAGVGAIVWIGGSTLAAVRGLCGAFAALWGGREWLGDLVGGTLALGLAAGAVALGMRWSARKQLRELELKYERKHGHTGTAADRESAADGRATAGHAGGSGDPGHRVGGAEAQ
jgi:hypothetical protein